MVLWQFIAIAVLIGGLSILSGGLVIYTRILGNRIGSTNATLRRIEEAVLADRLYRRAPATAAPATAAPAAAAPATATAEEASQSPETSAKDGIPGYLTIRDLRVISRARRSNGKHGGAMSPEGDDAPPASEELQISPVGGAVNGDLASSESHEEMYASGELQSSTVSGVVSEEFLIASAESHEPPDVSRELHSPPVSDAVSEDSLTPRSEGRDTPNTSGELAASGELPGSSGSSPQEEDLAEKRKQNELMFLANQRRRRRARAGY